MWLQRSAALMNHQDLASGTWQLEKGPRVLLLVGPSLVLDLGTAMAARAALGGHCVLSTWAQCEPGWEPTPDVHADCKPPDAVRGST